MAGEQEGACLFWTLYIGAIYINSEQETGRRNCTEYSVRYRPCCIKKEKNKCVAHGSVAEMGAEKKGFPCEDYILEGSIRQTFYHVCSIKKLKHI